VCIGVNHTIVDFKSSRKRDLDLVVVLPANESDIEKNVISHADIGESMGVEPDLRRRQTIRAQPVGNPSRFHSQCGTDRARTARPRRLSEERQPR